jgi:hypothetical protein
MSELESPTLAEHAMFGHPAGKTCGPLVIAALFIALAFPIAARGTIVIDDFEGASDWIAAPSDGVSLTIGRDSGRTGQAMRLDYDFKSGSGWAIARKPVTLDLPENYEFSFWIRAESPVNTLEFKVLDEAGENVWWINRRDFVFPAEWTRLRIKRRHLGFAWGPSGGAEITRTSALEIVVTAATGGKGTVWIDDFTFTPLEPERPYDLTPVVRSSSEGDTAALAMDGELATAWSSGAGERQSVEIDFLREREFGGIVIDWGTEDFARRYEVQFSDDGSRWVTVRSVESGSGGRDYLYLPESDTRHVRLDLLESSRGRGYAIREIRIEPLEFSKSRTEFFRHIAADAPRGTYPKYFGDVQSYWTIVGVPTDDEEALINEEGAIEIGAGGFSLEPFLTLSRERGERREARDDGTLITHHSSLIIPPPVVPSGWVGGNARDLPGSAGVPFLGTTAGTEDCLNTFGFPRESFHHSEPGRSLACPPPTRSGRQATFASAGMMSRKRGERREARDDRTLITHHSSLIIPALVVTWADAAAISQTLDRGNLPIPTVAWTVAPPTLDPGPPTSDPGPQTPLRLAITAWASGNPGHSVIWARYRLTNDTGAPQRGSLHVAIRPFQVNPPWQFLAVEGGASHITRIAYDGELVDVDERTIVPLTRLSSFGAATFDEGDVVAGLRQGALPTSQTVDDSFSAASGLMTWAFDLQPGASQDFVLAVPLAERPASLRVNLTPSEASARAEEQLTAARAAWESQLGRVEIELPESASHLARAIRSNLAYILINIDGPRIQPGSRSYDRSWIRDGALTSAALLRLGHPEEVVRFLEWYAQFQYPSGKIPCCVDARGADPVDEHDSHGQFIYLAMETWRFTEDRALLMRMWPHVVAAVDFIDALRQQRRTPEYQTPGRRAFYGLVPESISHEGYSEKPMHSYWDTFFILKGLKDAVEMAEILERPEERERFAAMRDEFRTDLYASLERTMAMHGIDYLPGSVELGDFDATSTTIALSPVDELPHLPQPALQRTFDKYYENFVARRDGRLYWVDYTPYEWRVAGTFIRLGQKERAHELIDFFFGDSRPPGWNHWAEVVFRDPATPRFIGDMPHTWVGSDFIRSILDLFAYEREHDRSLVLAAGVPVEWLRGTSGIRIARLRTYYGLLTYAMFEEDGVIRVQIDEGLRIPPGGLVLISPIDGSEIAVRTLPGDIRLEAGESARDFGTVGTERSDSPVVPSGRAGGNARDPGGCADVTLPGTTVGTKGSEDRSIIPIRQEASSLHARLSHVVPSGRVGGIARDLEGSADVTLLGEIVGTKEPLMSFGFSRESLHHSEPERSLACPPPTRSGRQVLAVTVANVNAPVHVNGFGFSRESLHHTEPERSLACPPPTRSGRHPIHPLFPITPTEGAP